METRTILLTTHLQPVYSHGFLTTSPPKRTRLGPATRRCLWCGRSKPDVDFRSIAHIIPEGLGNKHLVTSEECSGCNAKLGRLIDNDFLARVAPFRAFLVAHGKSGRVTIRAPNRKSKVRAPTPGTNLEIHNHEEEPIVGEIGQSSFDIRLPRAKHRPVAVARELARMALLAYPAVRGRDLDAWREWIRGDDDTRVAVFFEAFVPGANQERVWLAVFKYVGDRSGCAPLVVAFGFGPLALAFHVGEFAAEYEVYPVPALPLSVGDGTFRVLPWRVIQAGPQEVLPADEVTITIAFGSKTESPLSGS